MVDACNPSTIHCVLNPSGPRVIIETLGGDWTIFCETLSADIAHADLDSNNDDSEVVVRRARVKLGVFDGREGEDVFTEGSV